MSKMSAISLIICRFGFAALGVLALTLAGCTVANDSRTQRIAYLQILPKDDRMDIREKPVVRPSKKPVVSARKPDGNASSPTYRLAAVRSGGAAVPRVFHASLPSDLGAIRSVRHRKKTFIRTILPLVLRANEHIEKERHRLLRIERNLADGIALGSGDQSWLQRTAQRYRVAPDDIARLRQRLDIIPPSLAIAQAAIESGWGTSRFALEGNALFGVWTWSGTGGLVPSKRPNGKTYAIKAYANIQDSVFDYVHNLNTHRAYRALRIARARLRTEGKFPDGPSLAPTLERYSIQGKAYVRIVRTIIHENSLSHFDRAKLEPSAMEEEVET
jgi:Bax protein